MKAWQQKQLTDDFAKLVIYEALIEGQLDFRGTWIATSTSSISTRNLDKEICMR